MRKTYYGFSMVWVTGRPFQMSASAVGFPWYGSPVAPSKCLHRPRQDDDSFVKLHYIRLWVSGDSGPVETLGLWEGCAQWRQASFFSGAHWHNQARCRSAKEAKDESNCVPCFLHAVPRRKKEKLKETENPVFARGAAAQGRTNAQRSISLFGVPLLGSRSMDPCPVLTRSALIGGSVLQPMASMCRSRMLPAGLPRIA